MVKKHLLIFEICRPNKWFSFGSRFYYPKYDHCLFVNMFVVIACNQPEL